MRSIIFYFSGTGNSLSITKNIADKLGEADVVPLTNLLNKKDIDKNYQIVGFVIPVYYIHAPKIAINALENIKLYEHQRVFIIVTGSGNRGYALTDMKNQLRKYNNNSIQEFRIRMPGNYILEYGAFPVIIQSTLNKKATKKADRVANDILLYKPTKVIKTNFLSKASNAHALEKISNFVNMGLGFSANSNCSLCKMCEKICPVQNITISSKKVTWNNKCQQCMACIQWCPQNAIKHPNLKDNRKRYTHPDISLQQLWRQK